MKKMLFVVALLMVMTAVQAQAGDKLRCEGAPNVSVNLEWGIVYIDIGYGTWDVCSIRYDRNGIAKEVCPTILKGALLAEAEGRNMQFSFKDAEGLSCNDVLQQNWHAPDPFPYMVQPLK